MLTETLRRNRLRIETDRGRHGTQCGPYRLREDGKWRVITGGLKFFFRAEPIDFRRSERCAAFLPKLVCQRLYFLVAPNVCKMDLALPLCYLSPARPDSLASTGFIGVIAGSRLYDQTSALGRDFNRPEGLA